MTQRNKGFVAIIWMEHNAIIAETLLCVAWCVLSDL